MSMSMDYSRFVVRARNLDNNSGITQRPDAWRWDNNGILETMSGRERLLWNRISLKTKRVDRNDDTRWVDTIRIIEGNDKRMRLVCTNENES